MKKGLLYIIFLFLVTFVVAEEENSPLFENYIFQSDSPETQLPFPIEDQKNNNPNKEKNNFDLADPSNMQTDIEYDPSTGTYSMVTRLGDQILRTPMNISYEDFVDMQFKKNQQQYLKNKSNAYTHLGRKRNQTFANRLQPKGVMPGNLIEITPKLSIDLTFGAFYQFRDNPNIPERSRSQVGPDFDMAIQANIIGNIGDLVQLNFNYNTKSNFSFDNQMNLAYAGKEDHIIKKIEAGNINFQTNSSLITGASNLMGLKAEMQFGRLTATTVISELQGSKNTIRLEGGAQKKEFEIDALNYDFNKHFFLGHYFRENFEPSLANLPMIVSNARVTRIEVWVTNTSRQPTNSRDVIALMDLGESTRIHNNDVTPNRLDGQLDNEANDLYDYIKGRRSSLNVLQTGPKDLENITDFQITNARLLSPTEFFYDTTLGYLTINRRLNADEVLAVAYEYTVQDSVYKVGEFSNELQGTETETAPTLIVKMLKSSRMDPLTPMWDLMMKNIYSLNAYQVSSQDFFLNIFYRDPGGGSKRYIPEGSLDGIPLLQVLQLDNLNAYNQRFPNGFFDFVPGRTIIPQKGRIMFPILEPFAGSSSGNNTRNTSGIRTYYGEDESAIAEKYAFDELYDSTAVIAAQYPEFNRFFIKGSYSSSVTSDISLGRMQIPEGSVIVTAGGAPLTEGVDYTVDYMMGRVKILRQDILNSGTPIDISFDSQNLVGINNKSLFGTRLDYWINDNFTLGGTLMNISENPFQRKTQYGNEPINNTIYGLDARYHSEVPFITKMLNALPILNTKEKSSITLQAEYAKLIPGHPKVVGNGSDIDNFEGAKLPQSLDNRFALWSLASAPVGEIAEATMVNDLDYGKNRALLNWNIYSIDLTMTPQQNVRYLIDSSETFYERKILPNEIWKDRPQINAFNNEEIVYNLSFYPTIRGPYNYRTDSLEEDGSFMNPEDSWGGVMQYLPSTDFEAMNYEILEFWMLDPFDEVAYREIADKKGIEFQKPSGDFIINLGDISEDVLKDGNIQYENGLPSLINIAPNLDSSVWGVTPATAPITMTFDNEAVSRTMQDVGLDGLNDSSERSYFESFINEINTLNISQEAKDAIFNDPSSDNFKYFLGNDLDSARASIHERYLHFNGLESNSPVSQGLTQSFSQNPTTEDLNRNNTLDDAENYYEYRISMREEDFTEIGKNYIVTKVENSYTPSNISDTSIKYTATWYQFQIPIRKFDRKVGNINGFRSIRYIRTYLKGFSSEVHLRFGTFDLIRNNWRKYEKSLFEGEDLMGINSDNINSEDFKVASVSKFENGSKEPIGYKIPNGVVQELTLNNLGTNIEVDERSMSINICNLIDGDARAVFKNQQWDVRMYKEMKAYVHTEENLDVGNLEDGDLTVFLRFGLDNTFNYYEFEKALKVAPNGTENPEEIWDSLLIDLKALVDVKQRRNEANFDPNRLYSELFNDGRIYIKGTPDLGQIKSIMVGVRNPSQSSPFNMKANDDGMDKCAEIWFNELKLQGFDEEGGSAALAMLDLKMADLGSVTFSGQMHTRGFGAVDAAILDRYLDDYYTYTLSTQLNLHKFTPKSWNLNIPFYASITEQLSTPKYDPFQGDIQLDDQVISMRNQGFTDEQIKEAKRATGEFETTKSYNLTDIKKKANPKKKIKTPLDISNFSATYRYQESNKSNPFISRNASTTEEGILTYKFAPKGKSTTPFKKMKSKNKLLRPIKDFNFTLMPSNLSFISNMNRKIGEVQLRSFGDENLPSYYDKRFDWNRSYVYKHKPAKSINLDFQANTTSFLDEPKDLEDPKEIRKAIWNNISNSWENNKTIGVMTGYNQRASASYKVPLNKFPLTSYLNAKGNYKSNYAWNGANQVLPELGNNITNGRDISLNASLKSRTLYKEIKNLSKKIQKAKQKKDKEKEKDKKKESSKKDLAAKDAQKKKNSKKKRGQTTAGKYFKRAITGIKTTSITYSDKRGSVIPGFMLAPSLMGQSGTVSGAPGLNYTFGMQPFANQFSTQSSYLNNLSADTTVFSQDSILQALSWSEAQNINAKFGVEWIKSFRIDLTWTKNFQSTTTGYFQNTYGLGLIDEEGNPQNFQLLTPRNQGNYKFSWINWNSAFTGLDLPDDDVAFRRFLENRQKVSQILPNPNTSNHDQDEGFKYGQGMFSQEVMIPAFIAAYSNKEVEVTDSIFSSPNDVKLIVPKPNWRMTYSGLHKLKPIKKYFKNITIAHSYSSTYNISSFISNLEFDQTIAMEEQVDTNGNYIGEHIVSQISMMEKFSPLISVKAKMKNGFDWNLSISRSRNVNLSFSTFNVNEQKSREVKFGGGYKIKPGFFIKPLNYTTIKPINTKIDFSIRDNITTLYGITDEVGTHTGGTKAISILIAADYQYSKNMNIKFNLDWKKTIPHTSNNFNVTSLNTGVTLRYTM